MLISVCLCPALREGLLEEGLALQEAWKFSGIAIERERGENIFICIVRESGKKTQGKLKERGVGGEVKIKSQMLLIDRDRS